MHPLLDYSSANSFRIVRVKSSRDTGFFTTATVPLLSKSLSLWLQDWPVMKPQPTSVSLAEILVLGKQ
jgi:hypothetical protein